MNVIVSCYCCHWNLVRKPGNSLFLRLLPIKVSRDPFCCNRRLSGVLFIKQQSDDPIKKTNENFARSWL